MTTPSPICPLLTDPPRPGTCKLRIKTDGTWEGTSVVTVDSEGVERELLYVNAVDVKLRRDELVSARLQVDVVESNLNALELKLETPR